MDYAVVMEVVMKIQERKPRMEAIQFDPEKVGEAIKFLGMPYGVCLLDATGKVVSLNLRSSEIVSEGDWIVRHEGRFFILDDASFHRAYEVAE